MVDCTRKTIFGRPVCRFEGRYDIKHETPMANWIGGIAFKEMEKLHQMSAARETYVRDVCVKCGRTIERNA